MSNLFPNVQKLILEKLHLELNLMKFIAALPLKQLIMPWNILSNDFVRILCDEESKARLHLRIIVFGEDFIKARSPYVVITILERMPNLQYFSYYSLWCSTIRPREARILHQKSIKLDLKSLAFSCYRHFKKAIPLCPNVTKIRFTEMILEHHLLLLPRCQHLTTVRFRNFIYNTFADSKDLNMATIQCPTVVDVGFWVTRYCVFEKGINEVDFSGMFPNMETLKLTFLTHDPATTEYDGDYSLNMGDKHAKILALHLSSTKLKRLLIVNAEYLTARGVKRLLKIPPLNEFKLKCYQDTFDKNKIAGKKMLKIKDVRFKFSLYNNRDYKPWVVLLRYEPFSFSYT